MPAAVAIALLDAACRGPAHTFWPCTPSILDDEMFDRTRILGPRQLTDAYLLALASEARGRFVTFDRSVPMGAVHGATAANLVVL